MVYSGIASFVGTILLNTVGLKKGFAKCTVDNHDIFTIYLYLCTQSAERTRFMKPAVGELILKEIRNYIN